MKKVLLMAAAALLLLPGAALADTIDFSGSVGILPSSQAFGVITAYGWVSDGAGGFNPTNLFQRDQGNDRGIGVCSEGPIQCAQGNTPPGSGAGDINEVDNFGRQELLSLGLQAGYNWVSVQLSSLDGNVGKGDIPERGILYACDSANPNTFTDCEAIAFFQFSGNIEPIINIPAGFQGAAGLFFLPYDWTGGGNMNNDFLVKAATVTFVPEPATLGLLGMGLGSLALALKRRKK